MAFFLEPLYGVKRWTVCLGSARLVSSGWAALALAFAVLPARAGLLWYADPAKGAANFKTIETDNGTDFSVVDDPQFGRVFRFNRTPGSNRCEAKGAAGYNTKDGELIYIGMRYRIVAPANLTVTGIFQWKTYPTDGHPNDLNFPLLIRPNNGRLVVEAHKPRTDVWSIPTPIGTWFTMVLAIHQSYDQDKGWIEFWYNGQKQVFSNESTRFVCKTLAGGNVEPKWGIYGTNSSAKPQSASFITDLRIGTDYASAAPESGTSLAIRDRGMSGAYGSEALRSGAYGSVASGVALGPFLGRGMGGYDLSGRWIQPWGPGPREPFRQPIRASTYGSARP